MSDSQLQLKAPDRRRDGDAMIDLIAKVFSRGHSYFGMRNTCRDSYVLPSHYDWKNSRIGFLDGQIVTHYGVWDYAMRIGSCQVRCAGIGAVATHEDYRKRGLMDLTARASLDSARADGYDLSLLYGIWNFYHRFGYVSAWPKKNYVIGENNLPREAPTVRLRRFLPRHSDVLCRTYNRDHAGLTGTAVRPTYRGPYYMRNYEGVYWVTRPALRRSSLRPRSAPAASAPATWDGYVIYERKGRQLAFTEACGPADEVLRVCGALCRKLHCDEARFETFHEQHPVARRLRAMNCRAEESYTRSGDAMILTVNLRSTLGKIAPELSRRLKRSPESEWSGDLLLRDSREAATLRIRRGQVEVADVAAPAPRHAVRGNDFIAQLLIGSDHPLIIADNEGMRLSGDARRLLPWLFPIQYPMLSFCDQF
mgnify:CR=1 FL=1